MRRRLEPELRLDAPDVATLVEITKDLASAHQLTIEDAATAAIAQRALFPWQVKLLFNETRLVALQRHQKRITTEHADRAFQIIQIDENGLLREDRDIITALMRSPYRLATKPDVVRYRLSEEAVCAAAAVDRATYKKRVQPKLMRLGYLTTTGGQCLTEAAVATYSHLMTHREHVHPDTGNSTPLTPNAALPHDAPC
jgi:Holliday junction resolvasome RuvABC ATP-dependent DNA helicase subunit